MTYDPEDERYFILHLRAQPGAYEAEIKFQVIHLTHPVSQVFE